MYYIAVKHCVVLHRAVKQCNKKFKVDVNPTETYLLFIVLSLRDKGASIEVKEIKKALRLLEKDHANENIFTRLMHLVGIGFLSYTEKDTGYNFSKNVYYVEPLLISYLNYLEIRLKKVRWDY